MNKGNFAFALLVEYCNANPNLILLDEAYEHVIQHSYVTKRTIIDYLSMLCTAEHLTKRAKGVYVLKEAMHTEHTIAYFRVRAKIKRNQRLYRESHDYAYEHGLT